MKAAFETGSEATLTPSRAAPRSSGAASASSAREKARSTDSAAAAEEGGGGGAAARGSIGAGRGRRKATPSA